MQIGGRLHDDCVSRKHIPPGFAYQLWLDKVKDYRTARATILQAQASEASVRLMRRGPPNIPTSVSGTVTGKSERAVTGGRSMVMLMGTPEGKIADLRKQKDAVMYLSDDYDEDNMLLCGAVQKDDGIRYRGSTKRCNGARKGGS